jgi:predicted aspartyl protease
MLGVTSMTKSGPASDFMKLSTAVLVAAVMFLIQPTAYAQSADLDHADSLFHAGQFTAAESVYASIAKSDPDNYSAAVALGCINLFRNSFADADKWLNKALELKPDELEPKAQLAELYYREDDFNQSSHYFRDINRIPKADKLAYFSDKTPYQVESSTDVTKIPFVQTDPLPVIKLSVNGSDEELFLIDTGGWELIISNDFADKIGAKKFGEQPATFAGGKKAPAYQGAVDQVKIGDFVVKNVPVNINNSPKRISTMFEKPIVGVVGTVFLYHFIFTLDYPGRQLILQQINDRTREEMKKRVASGDEIVVPFWMAGDHIMVVWATVNGSRPVRLFVDTGLAGGGFTGADWLVKEAGIELPEESFEGMGGGGKVSVKPAVVKEIDVGGAKETNVQGLFGAMPPNFGDRLGFQIGGIISHGFFKPYSLTFDFTTMNLLLRKAEQ